MDFPQRREVRFSRNASPEADAGWDSTAVFGPQHPQSAPSSHSLPVPSQPYGHADVVQDAMFPLAAGIYWPEEDWEYMPPPVENHAAQGQPQDLRYLDMGYCDMGNDHPRDNAINNYAGVALDIPAQAQAAPPAPIDIFDGPAWDAAAGPARAVPDEWPPQGPVPIRPANEILRELAILYVREHNSQVALIRMEPGHAHGVRVVITLELANF